MISFKTIRARAEQRKGGPAALDRLLPPKPDFSGARSAQGRPRAGGNDEAGVFGGLRLARHRSEVARLRGGVPRLRVRPLVFRAGRFLGGADEGRPHRAQRRKNPVGQGQRPFCPRHRQGHKSFGAFLANWPSSDEVGLLEFLAKRGDRLGGNTGQMLLRFLGWDGFVTSKDVVACLRDAGLDVAGEIKSKRDLKLVQEQFNAWANETGLPYSHLSRICAYSIGENYAAQEPARRVGHEVRYE